MIPSAKLSKNTDSWKASLNDIAASILAISFSLLFVICWVFVIKNRGGFSMKRVDRGGDRSSTLKLTNESIPEVLHRVLIDYSTFLYIKKYSDYQVVL